ncbi:MAG: BtpA/SgcQ family protein [Chthoniobacterales bacterium]
MSHTIVSGRIGQNEITFETGKIAKLADGAVMVRTGDTIILASAVSATKLRDGQDFFPLTVDYKEKAAAAGKFPGGYFKREGRPTEKETLTARMTDRPLRPLFPKDYFFETQIISLLLSADGENDADILSINGASAALAVALAAGLDFIRAEGFVFGHMADEGWMDACAGPLLRYRKQIGADHIAVWVDVKKKHAAHAMTADVSLAETVKAAEFFGADAVIVTGEATGRETSTADLSSARGATKLPVIVGSGVTAENAAAMLRHADAVIVGSALKRDGHWTSPVDLERVKAVAAAVRAAR